MYYPILQVQRGRKASSHPKRALPKQWVLVVCVFFFVLPPFFFLPNFFKSISIDATLKDESFRSWCFLLCAHKSCYFHNAGLSTKTPSLQTALIIRESDAIFFFFFLQSVFKAFNKHITDFQKLVASLGQIHCMVCHIHLPSIYVRKWQVKLAHTTINPCVHSFLLIPHCTVTIRYAIKTQIPSTQLCGDLLHKQLLEGIKHSTNVVTLLPPVWRQKPYHSSAMLHSHITSLLHVLLLL